MHTLILDAASLQQLVVQVGVDRLMDDLIDRLHQGFREYDPNVTEIPQRTGFHYEDPTGLIEWMPLYRRADRVFMKVVGYHPTSPLWNGMPTIVSTMSTYDTSSGHLTAIVDGTFLTAMRTGASSAVATELLARSDSEILGLVGCGAQAVTQLHAISRRFQIREVLVHDVDQRAAGDFASRAAVFASDAMSITPTSLEEIASRADIICTATSVEVGGGPVISLARSQPWLHVNAVGSDFPGKTELPREFLERSLVCPDFPQQARIEGECQQLSPRHIGPTIVDVARSPDLHVSAKDRQSVFDSTGWALEDWVAMELVMEHATQLGIGRFVTLECLSADPRNPYAFLIPDDSRRVGQVRAVPCGSSQGNRS
jgi:ornithine cyclodeaminase/alanine dehydrogenase-like protein (mu-crystallin family)